ncbi:hypothetical protein [Streptomyces sp. enrichment culture]
MDIVTGDHTASPVPGVHTICYVNAFGPHVMVIEHTERGTASGL